MESYECTLLSGRGVARGNCSEGNYSEGDQEGIQGTHRSGILQAVMDKGESEKDYIQDKTLK